jgi:hypothetical protein
MRRLSKYPAPPPVICEETLDELLDENDPADGAHYNTQAKMKQLPITGNALQANMSKRRGAKRFKKLYIK